MSFPGHIWDQLRSISADELIGALERDGFELEPGPGSIRIYRHPTTKSRVSVHYHPNKTFGPKLLKGLLEDIGWSVDDLKRLKLVK
ncbi:type II toxin-antitoxin system HicA family toxin [Burkholderia ubonensis]|uniref:type II toxin-antitoxin system HicA family toxin n=1 Tax=Burkholderia ubonensis TaxID=101571 RepID=UPI00076BCD23|nr:type II toxin-antitoxin system HicA family toxin [Burkholderia ubonensis]KWB54209.1 hypothetical protein WL36_02210 [Burkholderia ubonensis]